jgi:hypothetical protein
MFVPRYPAALVWPSVNRGPTNRLRQVATARLALGRPDLRFTLQPRPPD